MALQCPFKSISFNMFSQIVLISFIIGVFGRIVPDAATGRLPNGRIVGGQNTDIENFPHQISLRWSGSHTCGGSIINPTIILTAAHCFDYHPNPDPSFVSIRAGSTNSKSGGVVKQVKTIIIHEKYITTGYDYDFAILVLDEPLEYSDSIKPINLPEQGKEYAGETEAIISGWGRLYEGGPLPKILQSVDVKIVDHKKCSDAYNGIVSISNTMICAGDADIGSCTGDSGGPMIVDGTVVGLVSWAVGCARPNYPTVLAKVSSVRTWIDKIIKEQSLY